MSFQLRSKRFSCFVTLLTLCASCAFAFDPAEQDDSLALLRHFEKAEVPPPFEGGKFEPLQGETVTLIGGTEMLDFAETGYFEYMLQSAYPDRNLSVRSIAWSADTVYRQQRPMFFFTATGDTREGSVPDLRERIAPGIFVLQFGKMESLEGEAALPRFRRSYDDLLGGLKAISPRLVVLAPVPFFAQGPAASLAVERNTVLAKYQEVIRRLAEKHGALVVDYQHEFQSEAGDWELLGMGLADHGFQKMVAMIDETLGLSEDPLQLYQGRYWANLLDKIHDKDLLWQQYYRPTNWAFLFGDRQNVPSSRDYRDDDRRWFVEEIQRLPSLIEEADQEIWRTAAQ